MSPDEDILQAPEGGSTKLLPAVPYLNPVLALQESQENLSALFHLQPCFPFIVVARGPVYMCCVPRRERRDKVCPLYRVFGLNSRFDTVKSGLCQISSVSLRSETPHLAYIPTGQSSGLQSELKCD